MIEYNKGPSPWVVGVPFVQADFAEIERRVLGHSSQCIGAMIEEASVPGCEVWQAGDTSGCATCGRRWDTNEEPNNRPPDCGLAIDPFRGGLLT